MPESPREELARRLAAYPREATVYFGNAFAVAATLPAAVRRSALEAVVHRFHRGSRRLNGASLQSVADLNDKDADQLATIYSLFIGLLGESQITIDEFIETSRGVLFEEKNENAARSIAEEICNIRPSIGAGVEKAQLAGESLPSLVDVVFLVDLRVRIVNKRVKIQVPVAIMHLNTDVNRDEIFVQLTRADVNDLIEKLKKCSDDMEFVDELKFQDA